MVSRNYLVALVIVVVILLFVYYFTTRKEKTSNKKSKAKTRRAKAKPVRKNKSVEADEPDENYQNAEELYNLVHEEMINGLQLDQFQNLAGDLGNSITFIDLKQLYNQCQNNNTDPNNIKVEDYVKILEKADDN